MTRSPTAHRAPRRPPGEALRPAHAASAIALVLAACSHDWDTYDPRLAGAGGAGGTGGAATTGGTSTTGGSGGETTTGGTGGAVGCEPDLSKTCYSGPEGTADTGICKHGLSICQPDGMTWGACMGEVTPVVEDCALPTDDDCNGVANDHCGLWAKQLGESGEQRALAVAVAPSGNIVVAGRMTGTMKVGQTTLLSAGGYDAFVLELTPDGAPIWGQRLGDSADQEAWGVAVDGAGNVLVTGIFAGSIDLGGGPTVTSQGLTDAFVVKLDPGGKPIWLAVAGGPLAQEGVSIAADAAGDVIVTGGFDGATDFGLGVSTSADMLDAFVWKIGAAGSPKWVKTFGGYGDDEALSVVVGPSNHLFVTGYFDETVDFGDGVIKDGGGLDVFLAEMLPTGDHVFGRGYPAAGDQIAVSVGRDAAGDLFLYGWAYTEVSFGGAPIPVAGSEDDVFAAKVDSKGDPKWTRVFGDEQSQEYGAAVVDSKGDLVLSCSVEGTIDFGGGPLVGSLTPGDSSVAVAKLSGSDGSHVWSRIFGDDSDQDARAMALCAGDAVVVAGEHSGNIDFGTGVLDNVSGDDVFVAKLPP